MLSVQVLGSTCNGTWVSLVLGILVLYPVVICPYFKGNGLFLIIFGQKGKIKPDQLQLIR